MGLAPKSAQSMQWMDMRQHLEMLSVRPPLQLTERVCKTLTEELNRQIELEPLGFLLFLLEAHTL